VFADADGVAAVAPAVVERVTVVLVEAATVAWVGVAVSDVAVDELCAAAAMQPVSTATLAAPITALVRRARRAGCGRRRRAGCSISFMCTMIRAVAGSILRTVSDVAEISCAPSVP
jgi:hypothetical protein